MGQGNIFTSLCHPVHGGRVCIHWGLHPGGICLQPVCLSVVCVQGVVQTIPPSDTTGYGQCYAKLKKNYKIVATQKLFTQECIPVGCVPSAAVAICWVGCLPRGCLPGGLPGGCTPPPCGQTDTCENITFPQLLLRMVKNWRTISPFTDTPVWTSGDVCPRFQSQKRSLFLCFITCMQWISQIYLRCDTCQPLDV